MHLGHLGKDRGVLDLRQGHRDPELGHPGAPPARPHERDPPLLAGDVGDAADERGRGEPLVGGKRAVALGHHVDDAVDLDGHAVADHGARRLEEHRRRRDLRGSREVRELAGEVERAALQQVDAVVVAFHEVHGELDVHRMVVGLGDRAHHRVHLGGERRAGEQPLKGRHLREHVAHACVPRPLLEGMVA